MLNKAGFSFLSEINSSTLTLNKPQVNTSGTSFLSAFQGVVAQKAAQPQLTIDPQIKQFTAATISLKKKVDLKVPHLKQGHNECGPTSLDMIFEYYGIKNINHHNMFSSETFGLDPTSLREKAKQQGFTVRQENNGTLKDLARLADNGIPSMVLGSIDGDLAKGHWMVFAGYETDEAGNINKVLVNDPNSMTTRTMSVAEFNKFWNKNLIPGGHNYYMTMAKPGTFQEKYLKQCLPNDEISHTFSDTLKGAHALVSAGNSIAHAFNDAVDEVSSWFS